MPAIDMSILEAVPAFPFWKARERQREPSLKDGGGSRAGYALITSLWSEAVFRFQAASNGGVYLAVTRDRKGKGQSAAMWWIADIDVVSWADDHATDIPAITPPRDRVVQVGPNRRRRTGRRLARRRIRYVSAPRRWAALARPIGPRGC